MHHHLTPKQHLQLNSLYRSGSHAEIQSNHLTINEVVVPGVLVILAAVSGGLLLGLGVSMLDGGTSNLWGMRAQVGVGKKGKQPDTMHTLTVSAEGENMGRDAILPALEDKLSNEKIGRASCRERVSSPV